MQPGGREEKGDGFWVLWVLLPDSPSGPQGEDAGNTHA